LQTGQTELIALVALTAKLLMQLSEHLLAFFGANLATALLAAAP
jgi:hypothetical protein